LYIEDGVVGSSGLIGLSTVTLWALCYQQRTEQKAYSRGLDVFATGYT